MFGSVKTIMIELFDERYVVVTKAATAATTVVIATGLQGRGKIQYHDFTNLKPLEFDSVKDPITSIRWIFYVEGYFFTILFPDDQ